MFLTRQPALFSAGPEIFRAADLRLPGPGGERLQGPSGAAGACFFSSQQIRRGVRLAETSLAVFLHLIFNM